MARKLRAVKRVWFVDKSQEPKSAGASTVRTRGLCDEEVSLELVRLYFEEIARMGFKRSLDLDSIINAYFYTLQRMKRKDREVKVFEQKVEEEEKKLAGETKKQMFP